MLDAKDKGISNKETTCSCSKANDVPKHRKSFFDMLYEVITNDNQNETNKSAFKDIDSFWNSMEMAKHELESVEKIATAIFQKEAKRCYLDDEKIGSLTINEVIDISRENNHKCADCTCTGDCSTCTKVNIPCETCLGYSEDLEVEYSDSEISESADSMDNEENKEVSFSKKVNKVCMSTWGVYNSYDELDGELKKAVDIARKAYFMFSKDALNKFQAVIVNHCNDIPTNMVKDYFADIVGKIYECLSLLDIIDPSHNIWNIPKTSEDASSDTNE